MMNNGEKAEMYLKALLLREKDLGLRSTCFGKISNLADDGNLSSLKWKNECESYFQNRKITKLQNSLGLRKSKKDSKADIVINSISYSVKDVSKSPPAIINHELRPAYEVACNNVGKPIKQLDDIIKKYWKLRKAKTIGEDTHIQETQCPFKGHEDYLRPILEYFIFDGGGKGKSTLPAEKIIVCKWLENPIDIQVYDRKSYWNNIKTKLKFSLRNHHLPKSWKNENEESKRKWMELCRRKLRGQLHVRIADPPKRALNKKGC